MGAHGKSSAQRSAQQDLVFSRHLGGRSLQAQRHAARREGHGPAAIEVRHERKGALKGGGNVQPGEVFSGVLKGGAQRCECVRVCGCGALARFVSSPLALSSVVRK